MANSAKTAAVICRAAVRDCKTPWRSARIAACRIPLARELRTTGVVSVANSVRCAITRKRAPVVPSPTNWCLLMLLLLPPLLLPLLLLLLIVHLYLLEMANGVNQKDTISQEILEATRLSKNVWSAARKTMLVWASPTSETAVSAVISAKCATSRRGALVGR